MTDWLKDFLIPVLSVLVSTSVAMLAIRRSDQRERDKQRRDDLTKMLGEFIEIATKLEIKMVNQWNHAVLLHARKELGSGGSLDTAHLDLTPQIDSIVLRLEGAGEKKLSSDVMAHFKKIGPVQSYLNEVLQPCNIELSKNFGLQRVEQLQKARWILGKEFIAELERLKRPRRLAVRERFKGILHRAYECWLKL